MKLPLLRWALLTSASTGVLGETTADEPLTARTNVKNIAIIGKMPHLPKRTTHADILLFVFQALALLGPRRRII